MELWGFFGWLWAFLERLWASILLWLASLPGLSRLGVAGAFGYRAVKRGLLWHRGVHLLPTRFFSPGLGKAIKSGFWAEEGRVVALLVLRVKSEAGFSIEGVRASLTFREAEIPLNFLEALPPGIPHELHLAEAVLPGESSYRIGLFEGSWAGELPGRAKFKLELEVYAPEKKRARSVIEREFEVVRCEPPFK
ncbi:MAG: hypothetical protein DRO18_07780 [Thermoprotei archaeon]|nr:MAG: hypothetical protein DRO18_07780 [Thermoprotei archaeon]